jgi:hypothetical protein
VPKMPRTGARFVSLFRAGCSYIGRTRVRRFASDKGQIGPLVVCCDARIVDTHFVRPKLVFRAI